MIALRVPFSIQVQTMADDSDGQSAASILIVDDDASTLSVMGRLLRSVGYVTELAGSIAEAKLLCWGKSFDLVIADVRLPDGCGIDMLARLKRTLPARAIIVSGDSEELYEHLGLEGEYSDYLVKPIHFDKLLEVVRRVLAG